METNAVSASLNQTRQLVIDFFVTYGFQIIGAIMIMLAGFMLSRWLARMLNEGLEKNNIEPPVRLLMVRVVRLVVLVLTLVIALDKLQVQIAPLIAGIGVAGLGVGLALQGVLGNLLAGLVIIFTKPFRVGEYIEIHGEEGTVAQIELLSTILTHADKSRVIIPNRKILGEILHNYGKIRQIKLTIGVAYSTDLNRAITVVQQTLRQNPRVLKEHEPGVGIGALGDSAINLTVTPWVTVADYGAAQQELYKSIVEAFRANRLEMPFPQREIRVLNSPSDERRLAG
ncbi:MAG TPA: mechanosensitive ion channel family protein [Methylomirabilota bacterium]|nr:mechanosensitive ion channel family protein [Methylomirabilota bacterium]